MTLAELAAHLGAELRPGIATDPIAQIHRVASIDIAGPGDITFVSNPKYISLASTTQATAVLVEPSFPDIPATTLRLANPYLAFARAIELFYTPPAYLPGVHPTAVIAPTATIGANAHIGPHAVVMDHVILGDNAVLLPHVVLYPHAVIGDHFFAHAHSIVREYCQLGDHVILQNGAIIGADGFGFARQHHEPNHTAPPGAAWYKILQSGRAILGDNVEVQANATVDRASIGETRIQAGVKIDNLVQVGHGCTVGEDSLLCAQVGLAGSTKVGKNVIFAGQAASAGHNTIGDGVIVTAQSGIGGDVAPGKIMSGSPAIENADWLKATARFNKLPELIRDLKRSLK
jgi:UDP-3-O-[3-hydroxymyristoyl] glucosamine N-acyltransferase